MKRIKIEQLNRRVGKKVRIAGWVQTIRDQGAIKFLLIRDDSGVVQVVVKGSKSKTVFDSISDLTTESVVEILGLVKEEKQAPGGLEMAATSLSVLSKADPMLPIPIMEKGDGEASQGKRLDWRWLDLRKPKSALIFKIWTTMEQALVNHCSNNGFTRIHSPKFMSSPSESGGELFEVKYFDRKAYLAQSPQFYKQMAMASGMERVFEIGPVFRANPSFTSRHDTEWTSYDMEIAFIDSHQDVMAEEEKLIVAMLKAVEKKYGKRVKRILGRKLVVPKRPFPQIEFFEAKKVLKSMGLKSDKPEDLSPEEERAISKYVMEQHGHEFVFVTNWPVSARPFYHMRFEDEPELTKSFDLLWNGLEVTTGAQREHRYNVLIKQAKEKGLSTKSLKYYLDFFKYGCPPHGGLGMGASRMLMKLVGANNVREVTFLYRGVNRLTP
ncbi:MAG: aspartate--tRNA(Asn) ligase [Candidatus Colwellbacteria bacterium CG10_big_fil_rev_8_21_14_0_10_42_22]|uniref:Aspartate--tRNA(Asp/Asn) ligase n=1 Tax=Candidatus Colwellbacteria bacterium CG10_big_fil_rev_8_21_14_0_10_42_22 TaxID=1974540 RepID=A0A2H0VFN2_9BACT|nr:MAG: aspartate--tRNA(Asn) ligase [Candidatus Colwellbacteria bacterium CG10_big_fil_rev_8_21_14_0_10_42_22]